MTTARRAEARGFTLLEVMVAVAIMAMVSVLIYGAFDGLSRGKKSLGRVNDRYHQGRAALSRMSMELSSAFLSTHQPLTEQQIRRLTIFSGQRGSPAARVDFTSFSHRRLVRDSHESDQNEISYFGSPDPNVQGKIDLARRESPIIDIEPKRGGEVNVLVEDIDSFEVKYLDATTGLWTDTWDTTQATGQLGRLPFEVKLTLVLKGGAADQPVTFTTKVAMPMQAALSFAEMMPSTGRKQQTPRSRRDKRGVALVLVLGALAIMTVMLTEFQDEATGELSAALADRDALKAEYLAKSGINLARLLLSSEKTVVRPALSLLSFGKANPPQIPIWEFSDKILGAFNDKESSVDFAALTNTDPSQGKNLGIEGGRFAVDIIDEDSKLNVNVAARGDLITENRLALQLLALMGGDQYSPMFEQRDRDDNFTDRAGVCGAIIDWADADENMNQCDPRSATPVTQAAEDASYQLLKKPYFRKNAAYDSLEELHLVRGISDDFWATFVDPEPEKPKKRVLTVWGQGAMNVNTANEQDLLLLACAYATPQTKLCTDLTQMSNFLTVVHMVKAFLSGFPLFGSGQEFINVMSGRGTGMIGTFLKGMGIEPVVFTSATEAAKAATAESSVFSIYADGIVPGYQRKTRVRIHTVVDFRSAPPPGAPPVSPTTGGSDAGAVPPPATPPVAGQFGASPTTTPGSTDLSQALAPNPGGTIIYYRME